MCGVSGGWTGGVVVDGGDLLGYSPGHVMDPGHQGDHDMSSSTQIILSLKHQLINYPNPRDEDGDNLPSFYYL